MLSMNATPSADLIADIRARLQGVCSGYATAEFEALVLDIATVRAKYEVLRTEAFFAGARQLADAASEPTPRSRLSNDQARGSSATA